MLPLRTRRSGDAIQSAIRLPLSSLELRDALEDALKVLHAVVDAALFPLSVHNLAEGWCLARACPIVNRSQPARRSRKARRLCRPFSSTCPSSSFRWTIAEDDFLRSFPSLSTRQLVVERIHLSTEFSDNTDPIIRLSTENLRIGGQESLSRSWHSSHKKGDGPAYFRLQVCRPQLPGLSVAGARPRKE
jgi:hypothetical protein